jgi:RND family efflux transporter MFP subunit
LSRQQLDEAKLQLDSARSALAAAQAQVITKKNRFQAAHKEHALAASRVQTARTDEAKAQVQVDFASLRAPFDGVITRRWLNSGAAIKDASVPIFTIQRTDKMRVIIDVPERDVPYFRTEPQGNQVTLEVPAVKKESNGLEKIYKVSGTVAITADALDPVTRTMRTEIHLDNKAGHLKAQMTGTVVVTLAVRDAVTVPASAILRAGNKTELYIVADPSGDPLKGIVKRVEVQTGLDDGLRVEIKSDVLTGRELVIARGAGMLRPGDIVIAVPMRAAEQP